MLADRRYCYPLTITDFESRYLFACEALSSTKEDFAFGVFERVFKEFGVPLAIRTDNGVPFASPNALYGLSRKSGPAEFSRAESRNDARPQVKVYVKVSPVDGSTVGSNSTENGSPTATCAGARNVPLGATFVMV